MKRKTKIENRKPKNDQAQLYQKLVEDLLDLVVVAKRHDEESIGFEEMKRRIREGELI